MHLNLVDWLIDWQLRYQKCLDSHPQTPKSTQNGKVGTFFPTFCLFLAVCWPHDYDSAAFRLLLIVVLLSYQFLFIVVLLSLDLSILVSVTTSAYVHFCWSCCAIYPLVSVVVISLSTGVNCGLALCQHCFVLFCCCCFQLLFIHALLSLNSVDCCVAVNFRKLLSCCLSASVTCYLMCLSSKMLSEKSRGECTGCSVIDLLFFCYFYAHYCYFLISGWLLLFFMLLYTVKSWQNCLAKTLWMCLRFHCSWLSSHQWLNVYDPLFFLYWVAFWCYITSTSQFLKALFLRFCFLFSFFLESYAVLTALFLTVSHCFHFFLQSCVKFIICGIIPLSSCNFSIWHALKLAVADVTDLGPPELLDHSCLSSYLVMKSRIM